MNYIYHYDLAAILICIIVGGLFYSKKHFPSKSNRLFLTIGALIITASVFDVISVYTLSHIDTVPLWFNYLVNCTFFLAFNCTYIVYFIYILLITERNKEPYGKVVKIINSVVLLYINFVILTTPWLKLVFYFEDNAYKEQVIWHPAKSI